MRVNTTSTAFSSYVTGPSACVCFATTAGSTVTCAGTRKKTLVMSSQAIASRTSEIGSAITIHWPKTRGGASGKVISKILASERFGGVPTSVAIPPSEQAYAIPEHDAHGERVRVLLSEVLLHLENDGEPDGHHHDARGRIGDPHREEPCGHHEAEHDAGRATAYDSDDLERDAPVEIPLLHGQGDDEAPEKQHDRAVEVDRCGGAPALDSQERVEDQRHEGGREQRYRLGDPPRGHQGGHGRHARDRGVSGLQVQETDQDEQDRPEHQPDPLHAALLH